MNERIPRVSVKKGREWHIRRGHPWLFSGGISQAPSKVQPGAIVELLDIDGKYVATGYFNPNCDIAVRILTRKQGQKIDKDFLEERLRAAWTLRQQCINLGETNVFRLVNAEGDFLPGFIVDYYDRVLSVQSHTAGSDALLNDFIDSLKRIIEPRAIVLRNDLSVRKREGLEPEEARIIHGSINEQIQVKENGHSFFVDPLAGQKTGFFTDQRDKRLAVAEIVRRLPVGSSLFNGFCYTAGFSIYAASANWQIRTINVDESSRALDEAKANFHLNGIDEEKHEFHCADVFSFLESAIAKNTVFDVVILDPPAFAKSAKDKSKALKAYARMTRLGVTATAPDGILALCSCSGAVDMQEWIATVTEVVGHTGRSAQLIQTFQHGCDHPINLIAPEGGYLKVVLLRIS